MAGSVHVVWRESRISASVFLITVDPMKLSSPLKYFQSTTFYVFLNILLEYEYDYNFHIFRIIGDLRKSSTKCFWIPPRALNRHPA